MIACPNESFGLDLAGYSTTGSALALAERGGAQTKVTVLDGHCFAEAAKGSASLAEKTNKEVECLKALCQRAETYVDVPIDLQGLPRPADPQFVWQLTMRAVDRAFTGLPPLASRIGSYVARMQHLWSLMKAEGCDPLGERLFETYPAASLRLSGHASNGYKGDAVYDGGAWHGAAARNDAERKPNDGLAALLTSLEWTADAQFQISHDEFDAAVCALTGFGPQLAGEGLDERVGETIGRAAAAPRGYRLLRETPKRVRIRRQPYSECLAAGAGPVVGAERGKGG